MHALFAVRGRLGWSSGELNVSVLFAAYKGKGDPAEPIDNRPFRCMLSIRKCCSAVEATVAFEVHNTDSSLTFNVGRCPTWPPLKVVSILNHEQEVGAEYMPL
jgi:hypothetical protein